MYKQTPSYTHLTSDLLIQRTSQTVGAEDCKSSWWKATRWRLWSITKAFKLLFCFPWVSLQTWSLWKYSECSFKGVSVRLSRWRIKWLWGLWECCHSYIVKSGDTLLEILGGLMSFIPLVLVTKRPSTPAPTHSMKLLLTTHQRRCWVWFNLSLP